MTIIAESPTPTVPQTPYCASWCDVDHLHGNEDPGALTCEMAVVEVPRGQLRIYQTHLHKWVPAIGVASIDLFNADMTELDSSLARTFAAAPLAAADKLDEINAQVSA